MLEVFKAAAIEAGEKLLEFQSDTQVVARRETGDLTLQADLQSEAIIKSILTRELPEIPIIAEESDLPEKFPSTFITIDPLDGTIPYSRASLDWGVNIGYVSDGLPKRGVIFLPASGQLLSVDTDNGCYLNGVRQKPEIDPSERFILGLDLHYATDPKLVESVLLPLINTVKLTRSLGSTSTLTVDFAAGRTDAHLNQRGGGIWDIVVLGAVAISQGCSITDFRGEARRWDHNYTEIVVGRNQDIANKILNVTKAFIGSDI